MAITDALDAGKQKIAAQPVGVRFSLLILFLLTVFLLFVLFPMTFLTVTVAGPIAFFVVIFMVHAMAYIVMTFIKFALGAIAFVLLFIGLSNLLF